MITLKTPEQIEQIRHNGQILREATAKVIAVAKPGVSTYELDRIVEEYILSQQAQPTFKGYKREHHPAFKYASCISVNEVFVHGIPSKKVILKQGDIVSIDVGVTKNGAIADSCISFGIGELLPQHQKLLDVAKQTTLYGISLCKSGMSIHELAGKIFDFTASFDDYTIVPELYGHGTGTKLHEAPAICFTRDCLSLIPNVILKPNMVITIEPVICFKSSRGMYYQRKDHWSLVSIDSSFSAQFEHTVAIKGDDQEPDILTGNFG